ncbi:capZ-interacting protein isoform X3 [Sarcophilus harrisii]|uniref:capZ-interacting protein isoform X3 n=1 Tax=Sarcophilus harrisii TaxID=9305 RepID=UPI00062BE75E|nr:capZ-interacting protein isoform X3 [Sarcophilus harrisii]
MEERPADNNAGVDNSASPSVAQLAGRFREQAAAVSAKEPPANKPTRRKPPCSLSLFPPKIEMSQNGEEKPSPNACHPPKIKVKNSPLIEKLQANLAFDPAALLPGASPKSPGLKAIVSPFNSPPSTPNSPGVRSRSSESEELPVSFDQPPEGSHLPCYNKVRTRGSIKRRPPSRRFRRSQSDCGVDLGDLGAAESSQENGAKEENNDEVFTSKNKALVSPLSGNKAMGKELRRKLESDEKPLLRRSCSMIENPEERSRALDEVTSCRNAVKNKEEKQQSAVELDEEEPYQRATNNKEETNESPKVDEKEIASRDSGGDRKEKTTEDPTLEKEENSKKTAEDEEEKPGQKNTGAKDEELQQSIATGTNEEKPSNSPEEKEGDNTIEAEKDKEENEQKEGVSKNTDNQEIIHNQECHAGTDHSQPATDSETTTNEAPTMQSSCNVEWAELVSTGRSYRSVFGSKIMENFLTIKAFQTLCVGEFG